MREFFKGWRRKVGCVALLVAMLMAGVWARSHRIVDIIQVKGQTSNLVIISGSGKCHFLIGDSELAGTSNEQDGLWVEIGNLMPPFWPQGTQRQWISIQVVPLHVRFISTSNSGRHHAPYWLITLGPSVLSACLILWKPRTKPKAIPAVNATQTVPTTGT